MPSPSDFKRSFRLAPGGRLGSEQWEIEESSLGHVADEPHERYSFPLELQAAWASGGAAAGSARQREARRRSLASAFSAHCGRSLTVYSAYGSPYKCSFPKAARGGHELQCHVSSLDEEGLHFSLTATGTAVRRRDVPTLAQQAAAEREAAGEAADVSAEDQRRLRERGYRVIKSRFATSRCSVCHDTIAPGVSIGKTQSRGGRGGWAHAACLLTSAAASEGEANGSEAESEAESEEEEEERGAAPPRKRAGKSGSAPTPSGGVQTRRMAAAAASGGSKERGWAAEQ